MWPDDEVRAPASADESGAFVATAQAVSPRLNDDFGVVQSVANVLILSSAAFTEPPCVNGRSEGERVKPTNSKLRVITTGTAPELNCLLGIEMVAAARLADEKILVTPLNISTRVP